jgi:hypothetical protein
MLPSALPRKSLLRGGQCVLRTERLLYRAGVLWEFLLLGRSEMCRQDSWLLLPNRQWPPVWEYLLPIRANMRRSGFPDLLSG